MSTATGGGAPAPGRAAGATQHWLPRALRSGGARRARWGIVDQGISSFTNFAITAVVARQVAPAAFGAFSVALAVYICVLWVARSVVGEPFIVRLTPSPTAVRTAAARDAVGTAVAVGVTAGAVAVVVGFTVGATTGRAVAVMGFFLPGLLAQDAYRYVLMAAGRPRSAAANDAVWLAVQAGAVVVALVAGRAGVVALLGAFGGAATAAAIFGAWQTRAVPSVAGAWPWLQHHTDLWAPFLVELLTVNATPQLSMLAIAGLGGVVTVGALRAGMFLFAPLSVLFSGVYLVGLPEAVRLRRRSSSALRLFVVALGAAMAALTLAWAGALSLLPAHLGRTLLRSNWATGRRLLWPTAAFTAAAATTMAAVAGLRALEISRRSLRVRVWAGPVVFAAGVAGAQLSGAPGAATGLAVSSWLSAALAWIMLLRALAVPQSLPAPPGPVLVDGPPLVAEWA